MAPLTALIARYPVLQNLSSFLSTIDLFNLARTNRTHYSYILLSRTTFDALCRDCLCDGSGLAKRQDFFGLYSLEHRNYCWGNKRRIWQDEPIEIQLYGTKCDSARALPCRKCSINVCEECRYYPREPPLAGYPRRRPHLNSPCQNENIICLCPDCDTKTESEEIQGEFLNELCDCDIYTRWICHKCAWEEEYFTRDHYAHNTAHEWDEQRWKDGEDKTKMMVDHQHPIMFFCPCGAYVPTDTRPRCTWCKRRHLPEDEWNQEFVEVGSKMPIFDSDPCYPPYVGDNTAADIWNDLGRPYPPLQYDGPIWEAP
ncbi:uncharacterized protein A1O5_03153 [Cladophialophora psammophila CBS 110553]|uniref:Uncharacterized protein n=1 Tax=Cladophialophora psammophila CBS 110553 TaxID=1182543 RepID=W9WZP9_9EURO|nr:uncharacterized protein A1O5_03153 [Cladophialophora psammophila CBS 110553]EXJ73393.1 hypothetical protein A1O5_03153 [Cladophialophora psammophila CBS 110553]